MQWGGYCITALVFLSKYLWAKSNHEKNRKKNWGTFYKITCLHSSKMSMSSKIFEMLRNCSRLKETKDTWKQNIILDSGLVSRLGKIRYKRYNWNNSSSLNINCVLDNIIISMLNFLILIAKLRICKESFRTYALKCLG